MNDIKVKICGLTTLKDVQMISENKADYGGIVLFVPKSKRNQTIENARVLVRELNKSDIRTVAVTVSPNIEQIKEIETAGFDYVQIHGELSYDVYVNTGIGIIRAFNLKDEENKTKINSELKCISNMTKIKGVLIDAGEPGSGMTFDWSRLKGFEALDKMLFVAGGLNKDNVNAAIEQLKPDVVDASSGVENVNGIGKNAVLIKQFIENARQEKIRS